MQDTSNNAWMDYPDLPPFERADAADMAAAVSVAIEHNQMQLKALKPEHDSASIVALMDSWAEALHRAFSPLSHLHSVKDSPAIRESYEDCLAQVISWQSELGQNRRLYEALEQAASDPDITEQDARVIELALRDFRLAGVNLAAHEREVVRDLNERIGKAQSQFEKNVLDVTDAFALNISNQDELEGLPESVIRAARRSAEEAGAEGWQFSLQAPSYLPVMMNARSRALRQTLYEAFVTRASEAGPHDRELDNGPLILEILALRQQLAKALGFRNFAALSLESKMASSAEEVIGFLHELATRARPLAETELGDLQNFARERDGLDALQAWDLPYYSEQLRQQRYALSDDALRKYFPLPKVFDGLFRITSELYSVTVREASASLWHESVRYYEIVDTQGEVCAGFYLDLYARKGKRGGAWMDDCLIRREHLGRVQRPVAYLTCNFAEPEAGEAALLSHQEVTTLFHEFGHGLHHMLTRIDRGAISGINGVAWDAVELPSQLLENWCWHPDSLPLISAHVETAEPLPTQMFEQLVASRRFQAGLQMLRQVEFGLFDMRVHHELSVDENTSVQAVQDTLNAVREQIAVVPCPDFNRFQNAFTHIFAGGYAAGYYSYKWAEVLAADAFSAFEAEGVLSASTGKRFLDCLLSQGGLQDPMALFHAFMGRAPKLDALLKQAGIETV